MDKLQQAFQSGFNKEAQGMSPAKQRAIRRRIARAKKLASQADTDSMMDGVGDDFFRGAGLGGTLGSGLGYMKGSIFNKGMLGGILGGATLASDNIIDSFQ